MTIAYNASLGCATVALWASGHRSPEGDGHHYRTIESLRYTLRPAGELIASLQAVRKKRTVVCYDAAGIVTEAEVSEALELARELTTWLRTWLESMHPELLDWESYR